MVRFARDTDFDFVKKSWEECFDDPVEFVDWNFRENYCPENTIIAEADGNSASVMQLMPYKMMVGEKAADTRYVSGVATMPEYRGRGLVRELFDFGIPAMEDMECDVSILVPAVEGMYEKFGYRKICKRYMYRAENLGDLTLYNKITPELIGILERMYMKAMQEKSVYIMRDYEVWHKILTDLLYLSIGCVAVVEGKGYACAYKNGDRYDIPEMFGDIISAEKKEIQPVMARVINPEAFGESEAEKLFAQITAEKDAYINMLL